MPFFGNPGKKQSVPETLVAMPPAATPKLCPYLAIIALIVIMAVLTTIVLALTITVRYRAKPPGKDWIECPGLDEGNCSKLLCNYHKSTYGPNCYMSKNSFGFLVKSVEPKDNGSSLDIQLINIADETPYGQSLQSVTFKLTYITENILRFQFKDVTSNRYEVPIQHEFPLLQNVATVNKDNLAYEIIYPNVSDIFNFVVKRKSDSTYLWNTAIGGLLLSDQYLQIASYLPSENIYGLGEHLHESLKHQMDYVSWPMFARERPVKLGEKEKFKNLYGVHPFYTCLEKSGKSHGVFLLNSNAMEVTLMPAPAISFRTIGGILDFFIFVGESPENVIQLYTSLIGRPMIPPFWSLGFQLSQESYKRMTELKSLIDRNLQAGIPLSVQYLSLDILNNYTDISYNEENFPSLPEFMNQMKQEHGLKWIATLDPTIPSNAEFNPYQSGVNQSVFVKRASFWERDMFPLGLEDVNITFGTIGGPYPVAYPDYFLEETRTWWKDIVQSLGNVIQFDGVSLIGNTPLSRGTNKEKQGICVEGKNENCWILRCPTSTYEDPPYNPYVSPLVLKSESLRISKETLCMESVQGNDILPLKHYDVHNLYGWSQTQPTLDAAQFSTGTRSLVISRSTYPSSGRHAGHDLGDNKSSFEDMKRSIIGMLEFNLFGIPYVGASVCGYFSDANDELCRRWMQLGAFYPLYRNHNAMGHRMNDPAIFGTQVVIDSQKAILRRLNFNQYLYTLFFRAHVDGSTVVRPVFHEFPTDELTWGIDLQFMWGNALLVSPILSEGRKSLSKYLPKAEWWNFKYEESRKELFNDRYVIEVGADEYTSVNVRGGVVLPMGNVSVDNTTLDYYTSDIVLYVFPTNNAAHGELFVDDGISKDTFETNNYILYTFTYSSCTLKIAAGETAFNGTPRQLQSVVVFKVLDIASASSLCGTHNFTRSEKHFSATINVGDDLSKCGEVTWKASDDTCQMQP